MTEASSITLINGRNTDVIGQMGTFDFIYCDPMYETYDLGWVQDFLPHLKRNGIFIVQTDYHTSANYKVLLDSLPVDGGKLTFVNWLIYMNNWGGVPTNRFAQKHDDILVYCKGKEWKWYPDRIQIPKATAGTKFDKKGTGTKTPPSVFYDHASFSTMSNERVEVEDANFPMQKPIWLMERLLLPFTDEGDKVLDPFMGTATLGVVCRDTNRNYTGIEYIDTTYNAAKERLEDASIHI